MAYIGGKVDDNMATKIIIKMPLSASKLKKKKKKKNLISQLFLFLKKENNASKSQPRTLILPSLQTVHSQNLEIQLIH